MVHSGHSEHTSLPNDVWAQAGQISAGQLQDMVHRIKVFEDHNKQRAQRKAIIQARHGSLSPVEQAAIYDQRPRRGSIDRSFPYKSQRAIAFDAYIASRRNAQKA